MSRLIAWVKKHPIGAYACGAVIHLMLVVSMILIMARLGVSNGSSSCRYWIRKDSNTGSYYIRTSCGKVFEKVCPICGQKITWEEE